LPVESSESSSLKPRSPFRLLDLIRGVLLPAIEIGVGIVMIVLLATVGRTLIGGCLTATLGAAISFFSLMRVDAAATMWLLALALAKIGLALLPSVLLIRSAPRRRRLWLIPALAAVAIVALPVSLTACPTIRILADSRLLVAAGDGLARVRFLGWTVLLPYIILLEVVPSHGLLDFADVGTRDPAYRDQLLTVRAQRR
jgi:hypothetical protein